VPMPSARSWSSRLRQTACAAKATKARMATTSTGAPRRLTEGLEIVAGWTRWPGCASCSFTVRQDAAQRDRAHEVLRVPRGVSRASTSRSTAAAEW